MTDIALYRWRSTNPAMRGKPVNLGAGMEFTLDAEGLFPSVMSPAAEARLRELQAGGLKYERVAMNSVALWREKIQVAQDRVKACTEMALAREQDLIAARGLLADAQDSLKRLESERERTNAIFVEAQKAGTIPAA